ncbi:MAG: molybdenum cofactor guanylyltransferase MobA [Gammaproteobacteria bacterium]
MIPPAPQCREDTAGVILAGGRASRMGGIDKGLLCLGGRELVRHVAQAFAPQVAELLISANRNLDAYSALGLRVVTDVTGGYQGPLAGIASALHASTAALLAVVPCDSPFVAADLVSRLRAALDAHAAQIAVAHDGGRMQPVFALLRCDLRPSLDGWLARGERKVECWYASHRCVAVDFSDRPEMFLNINSPDDAAGAQAALAAGGVRA